MTQAWGDLSRHLYEVNVVRGAGFSGGTDVGVPESDHRLRWAPDSPLKFFIGLIECTDGDNLGDWVSVKQTDGIHDIIYPTKAFDREGDTFARTLSLKGFTAADYAKLVVFAMGPWSHQFQGTSARYNALDSDKYASVLYQLLVPQFIRGEAELSMIGLTQVGRPALEKIMTLWGQGYRVVLDGDGLGAGANADAIPALFRLNERTVRFYKQKGLKLERLTLDNFTTLVWGFRPQCGCRRRLRQPPG